MRSFLTSASLGSLSIMLASYAGAETVISTAVTTPLKTSVSGDIHITSTGSVKPAGGAAVTIDSNNMVKNEGTIAIQGANGATGILANTNLTGDITNTGTAPSTRITRRPIRTTTAISTCPRQGQQPLRNSCAPGRHVQRKYPEQRNDHVEAMIGPENR